MKTRRMRWPWTVAALVAAFGWALAPVEAADENPGFVGADSFVALVGDEAVSVEVNISPALIRMMTAGMRDAEPDLAGALEGLQGIRAVVLELDTDVAREGAERLIRTTVSDMEKQGWERMAVVRDASSVLHVMVRGDGDDRVRGLLVLILERESNELVFVNLFGLVDLAKLQALTEEMDLPGLDRIPPPEK